MSPLFPNLLLELLSLSRWGAGCWGAGPDGPSGTFLTVTAGALCSSKGLLVAPRLACPDGQSDPPWGKGQGLEELGSGQPRGPSAASLEPEARVVTIQACQPEGLLQSSQRRWPMSVTVPGGWSHQTDRSAGVSS